LFQNTLFYKGFRVVLVACCFTSFHCFSPILVLQMVLSQFDLEM